MYLNVRPQHSKIQTLIPNQCHPTQTLWPSQNSQNRYPLRPIVSSRGSITYGVAKELSHIIKPLVGQSPHHLKNTQHFIQQIQGKSLQPGDSITSFDVKALFTSVPVHPGQDSSVGRAADCHATGPGFNTTQNLAGG